MTKLAGRKPDRYLNTFFVHYECDDCDFKVVCKQKDLDKRLDAHTLDGDGHIDFTELHGEYCPCCGHDMHCSDHCTVCFCEIHERHCTLEFVEAINHSDCHTCINGIADLLY